MPTNRTREARGGSKLPRTLVSFRHCLAEPRQPRKKNTPCIFDLVGVKFLLKKERVFFFRGSAFQVFRQVAEKCGRSFGKTIFWGKDLPQLRQEKGLSQDRLSKLADLSLNTVVKIELDESPNPTIETMQSIAKALGVSVDDLLKK